MSNELPELPILYTAIEMTKIFRCSLPTLYRKCRDSENGVSDFPLPINYRSKSRLRWTKESIDNFLNAPSKPSLPVAPPKVETAKVETAVQRKKRVEHAKAALQKRGVDV